MNIKIGQTLKLKSRIGYQKILAIVEETALLSIVDDFKRTAAWLTFSQIEEYYELPKEKWEPKRGEMFYWISQFMGINQGISSQIVGEVALVEADNCFETWTEAEAALEKIKKILAE